MKKTLLLSCLLFLSTKTAFAEQQTYLVEGQVDDASFDSVEYLEHVDISIITVDSSAQRSTLSLQNEKLFTDDTRYLMTQEQLLPAVSKWHIDNYPFEAIWQYPALRSTKIAIIDTGISKQARFTNAVLPGVNLVDPTLSNADDHGHGTGLASIMLDVTGDLPVQLLPIKASDSFGKFKVSTIVQAIDYAIEQQADIINLSFGAATPHGLEQAAIQKAIEAGLAVVSSSGNSGFEQLVYPAAYDSVVSIGSIDALHNRSNFSTFNNQLDFVAPGDNLFALQHNAPNSYKTVKGTSYSSAYFSALLAVTQSLSLDGSVEALTHLATDLGPVGYDSEYGHGFVSPLETILSLRGQQWEAVSTTNPKKEWMITFNQSLQAFTPSAIQLMDAQLNILPTDLQIIQHQVQVTPIEPLAPGDYWLVVSKELQSITSQALHQPAFVKFTVLPDNPY